MTWTRQFTLGKCGKQEIIFGERFLTAFGNCLSETFVTNCVYRIFFRPCWNALDNFFLIRLYFGSALESIVWALPKKIISCLRYFVILPFVQGDFFIWGKYPEGRVVGVPKMSMHCWRIMFFFFPTLNIELWTLNSEQLPLTVEHRTLILNNSILNINQLSLTIGLGPLHIEHYIWIIEYQKFTINN